MTQSSFHSRILRRIIQVSFTSIKHQTKIIILSILVAPSVKKSMSKIFIELLQHRNRIFPSSINNFNEIVARGDRLIVVFTVLAMLNFLALLAYARCLRDAR